MSSSARTREEQLSPFAMRDAQSKGRQHPEPDHSYRGKFQRDRDRILHASAFRRLTAKTQVLVAGTNDHHRTRLTHTLEVAQVSRTIARELGLNEDLTEAIALVHDIGHPPFGHAGEMALDICLKEHGGFEHNRHGLRIVDELELRYPEFPGLNLTWEVRESLAFHSKSPDAPEIKPFRQAGQQPTLEAQVVDAADSVVYDMHDLEDAFGIGLISLDEVRQLGVWERTERELNKQYGTLIKAKLIPAVLRFLLAWRERALLEETRKRIAAAHISSLDQVRQHKEPLVQESPSIRAGVQELRTFLNQYVYNHHQVLRMSLRGKKLLADLLTAYSREPGLMPSPHAERARAVGATVAARDYVAGMTDRLAIAEHRDLFQSL
jgi:dGTPase